MKIVNMKIFSLLSGFILLIAGILVSGCNKDSVMDPPAAGKSNTTVSLLATAPVNTNTLTITSAKFLIREVELERAERHDEEEEIELGPFVAGIDLQSQTAVVALGNINTGTFHEIKFEIHKPGVNESVPDPDFYQGRGDDQRFSVIVTGLYNGTPFIYRSRVSANVEIELDELVNVSASSNVNITINIAPSMWFVHNNMDINPMDPDNRPIIDNNIRRSFREAFEDDEHHHEHHHGG